MTKRELYRIIIRLNFSRDGGIAQLARAFGSYPKCRRFESYFRYQRPGGQAVKTPPFHGGNTSSILVRVTIAPLTFVRGVIHILRRCGGIGRHKGLKIPRSKIRTGSSPVTGTSMSVHNGFMLWTLIFLFNFNRYVFGEQVFVPAHLLSYADLAVGIYSTSTPFRVLAL